MSHLRLQFLSAQCARIVPENIRAGIDFPPLNTNHVSRGDRVMDLRSGESFHSPKGIFVVPYLSEHRASSLAGIAYKTLSYRRFKQQPPEYIRMGSARAVRYAVEDLTAVFPLDPTAVEALAVKIAAIRSVFSDDRVKSLEFAAPGLVISFAEAGKIVETGPSNIRKFALSGVFGPVFEGRFLALSGLKSFMDSRRENAASPIDLRAALSESPALLALFDDLSAAGPPPAAPLFLVEAAKRGLIYETRKELADRLGIGLTILSRRLREAPETLPRPLPALGFGAKRHARVWSEDAVQDWERAGQVVRKKPGRPPGSRNRHKEKLRRTT